MAETVREPPVPVARVAQQVQLAGAHVVPAVIEVAGVVYTSAVDLVWQVDSLVP